MDFDKDGLKNDVDASFSRLTGQVLQLSEGFFKEYISEDKWRGFRKLFLDLVNTEQRYIDAKFKGKNYYKLIPMRKEQKDGR
jgi:hypothetical protein